MGRDRSELFRLATPVVALATPSAAAPRSTSGIDTIQLGARVRWKFNQAASLLSYLLPYLIGAQFGAVVGTAILQAPLSIVNAIDLAIAMIILLLLYGLMDLSAKLRRAIFK